MLFITLSKFKHKPTKEQLEKATAYYAEVAKQGVKVTQIYWTLGRYDSVALVEAPNEKAAMLTLMNLPLEIATETLVAVQREDAMKLLK